MARPAVIKAYFFQRAGDGAWLGRVDTQSPLSTAEAELHCAAEYGIPVRAVEVSLPAADFDVLAARRRVGAIRPPVQAPPPLTVDQQAWAAATEAQRLVLIAKRLGFLP